MGAELRTAVLNILKDQEDHAMELNDLHKQVSEMVGRPISIGNFTARLRDYINSGLLSVEKEEKEVTVTTLVEEVTLTWTGKEKPDRVL